MIFDRNINRSTREDIVTLGVDFVFVINTIDMKISIPKTKVLHVREQDMVSCTTDDEAKLVCKFTCPHPGCEFQFKTKLGMQIHAGKCEFRGCHRVHSILDDRGSTTQKWYLVRWEGYSSKWDQWVPRANVHPTTISEYEKQVGTYDFS